MNATAVIDKFQLDELTREIKRTMHRSARDAVQLGYMLRRVVEDKLYLESYQDFDSYLQCELQMDYSMANRFIGINKKFSVAGNSMQIADKYEQYSQGLLIEMLSMTPEQAAEITPDMTIKQAREAKQRDKKPKKVPLPEPKDENIIEGEFREIKEPVNVATSQPEEEATELYRLKGLLDSKKQELDECMKVTKIDPLPDNYIFERKVIVGALANMLCEMEELQDAGSEPVQPELPVLKNNDQRKAWLVAYKEWGLWYRDEHIDVNYYKYDFIDGSRLVVAEYPARYWNYKQQERDEYFYHLLEKDKKEYGTKNRYSEKYRHQTDSETYLIEFLKNLQKGAKL